MKKIIFIVIGILLLLISLVLAINNTLKLRDSEWVCISQECIEFATGDDWVAQNCKLVDKEMICEFQYEGEYFRVPLSGIEDISKMVSCKKEVCSTKVLVSKAN